MLIQIRLSSGKRSKRTFLVSWLAKLSLDGSDFQRVELHRESVKRALNDSLTFSSGLTELTLVPTYNEHMDARKTVRCKQVYPNFVKCFKTLLSMSVLGTQVFHDFQQFWFFPRSNF